jgi:hypothetical protein
MEFQIPQYMKPFNLIPLQNNVLRLFLLGFCFTLLIPCIKAQNLVPQAITSGASNFTQSNGSLSFTVGELIVTTETNGSGYSLGNGFISSAVSSTQVVAIDKPNEALLNVKVYPNPTSDLLFVDILSTSMDWIHIDIIDTQGRIISSEKYAGMTSHIGINTAKWQPGNYFLQLRDQQNKTIGNYQIIINTTH